MTTPEETYRRGSVVLRGDQIPRLTADASLLQTEHSADWKHTDPWRVLRIQSEFVEGFRPWRRSVPPFPCSVPRARARMNPGTGVLSGSANSWFSAATQSLRAAARA